MGSFYYWRSHPLKRNGPSRNHHPSTSSRNLWDGSASTSLLKSKGDFRHGVRATPCRFAAVPLSRGTVNRWYLACGTLHRRDEMKPKVRSPRYFRKSDEEIAKAIEDQFRWHTQVPEDLIKVTVEHGWVVLRGTVEWEFQKRAAERVVKRLTLVRGITNNITLKQKAHEAAGRLAA